jgi:hypothetical protein
LYSLLDTVRLIKSRKMRQLGHVTYMGEMRNAYKISARKPKGKTSLGRLKHQWEDNIKLILEKCGVR